MGSSDHAGDDNGRQPEEPDKIYDSYDDSNKGFVNYGGWLDGTALDPDNPPSAIQMERGIVTLTKSDGAQRRRMRRGTRCTLV